MKSRILAFLCVLALLVGMLPAGAASVAAAETATEETYMVGYAIKNFNPWVASTFDVSTDVGTAVFLENPEETADKKIYSSLFSQSGNQIDWESVVTDLYDDNGDGNVDHNDGIFATCTAVTYGEKTVLFITTDTMKAWPKLVNAVRDKIVASDWSQELGITADEIMVCSNHTHSGPQLDGSFDYYIDTTVFDTTEKQTAVMKDRETYFNWVVDRIVAVAEESVADQAPATMSKGAVDATEATAAKGYNSGNGYHMNTIRHYERTLTSNDLKGKISSIYANSVSPSHDKLVAALTEHNYENKTSFSSSSSYTTTWSTTDDADNTMYVLRFEFDEVTGKQPIAFVNWRAHSTMNSGVSHHILSGDYAVGLRKVLADEGYRAAFFQGAAGNVVPDPTVDVYKVSGKLQKDKMDWLYEATDKETSPTLDASQKTFIYGKMLAEIAQYCMEEADANGKSYMTETPVGEISTYKTNWSADMNKYDQKFLDAAIALRTEVMNANDWDLATFESNYRVFFNNNKSTYFPYYYKTDGKTVAIINSRLHFNTIYAQAKTVIDNGKAVANKTDAVELNAIMLGKNVAFITSPNELADYYHNFAADNDIKSHTSAEKEAHNDWLKLKDDDYGMPFMLGYANQNSGYIANWLDFQANSGTYYTITGKAAEGYMLYSPGTYESMTSSFAAGQGEVLIDLYDKLLDVASGEYDVIAPCAACGNTSQVWKPLFAQSTATTSFESSHYYLVEDLPRLKTTSTQKQVTDGKTLCINLNGYTWETEGRSFYLTTGGKVSIFNTEMKNMGNGGVIRSYTGANNVGGGVVSVGSGSTFNLYGGTMEYIKEEESSAKGTGNGGIFALSGTLNMYGGTIKGGDLVSSTYTNDKGAYLSGNGCGGAIYMSSGSALNMYGGKILSGTVPATVTTGTLEKPVESVGMGPCIYIAGSTAKITVANNAEIEDIYYGAMDGANLIVSGAYTGKINLSFAPKFTLSQGMDIGNAIENADIFNATISMTDTSREWNIKVDGSNLILSGYADTTIAASGNAEFTSLQEAVDAYNGTIIKMIRDEEQNVVVDEGKDIYLDLNGCSINSTVTVNGNYALYCKDSKTDDYTVSDDNYGRIKAVSGNIKGIPEASSMADDGYLKVTENDGVSFHRVNLDLTAMSLRVNEVDGVVDPSVYYKSNFMGDEKVAGSVTKYGVALSVKEMPNETNLENKCKYSEYTTFNSGNTGNSANGTLLKGIMKPTNLALINNRNANMGVYGRAYIETADGYLFGGGYVRTLKEQTEAADDKWSELTDTQKESIETMYETYTAVMKNWDLPKLKNAMKIS